MNSVINQLIVGVNINLLRVSFDLDHELTSTIDSWIKFAVKNKVELLELELLEQGMVTFFIRNYSLMSFCQVGFKYLKVLNLKSVKLCG